MALQRISPDEITKLEKNEIFVFGSNLSGFHGAGAAHLALSWGAKYGNGIGLQGKTYAIPTKDENIKALPIYIIKQHVDKFITTAQFYPELKFLVTQIGCGLAGYTPQEIGPLFKDCLNIKNIYLPKLFWDVIFENLDIS